MSVYLGIDLGSTTSKAVLLDDDGAIIGRGITNTRSDYKVAAEIARMDAEFDARFFLLRQRMAGLNGQAGRLPDMMHRLESRFHYFQFRSRYESLASAMLNHAQSGGHAEMELASKLQLVLPEVHNRVRERFLRGEISSTSEFFRDLFSGTFMKTIEHYDRSTYDQLVAVYDRSINPVENEIVNFDFRELLTQALELLPDEDADLRPSVARHLAEVAAVKLEPADYIGTGYGRQLLPFEQKHIKSEILCHALGAHSFFPGTRTVLDIGGQDTKAIQVDEYGLVTSFQMNDRCAAGCGRYLGYIADEMNISVSELGPLAMGAERETNICSTCTVFAGAELREQLNLGERKENVLAGLHLAIVQRAFALLARSGGARDEFTFTGGVARNRAVVKYVSQMARQNYGELKINIHPDSIFMGALGAAVFCLRRR